jgi:hypothetical protein
MGDFAARREESIFPRRLDRDGFVIVRALQPARHVFDEGRGLVAWYPGFFFHEHVLSKRKRSPDQRVPEAKRSRPEGWRRPSGIFRQPSLICSEGLGGSFASLCLWLVGPLGHLAIRRKLLLPFASAHAGIGDVTPSGR